MIYPELSKYIINLYIQSYLNTFLIIIKNITANGLNMCNTSLHNTYDIFDMPVCRFYSQNKWWLKYSERNWTLAYYSNFLIPIFFYRMVSTLNILHFDKRSYKTLKYQQIWVWPMRPFLGEKASLTYSRFMIPYSRFMIPLLFWSFCDKIYCHNIHLLIAFIYYIS